jgi:hypothetical protein
VRQDYHGGGDSTPHGSQEEERQREEEARDKMYQSHPTFQYLPPFNSLFNYESVKGLIQIRPLDIALLLMMYQKKVGTVLPENAICTGTGRWGTIKTKPPIMGCSQEGF